MHVHYYTHTARHNHTLDTSNGVVHIQRLSFRSITILKRQSDRVSKQQPNRPSRQAFPNSIATQNTQATCSVRLFCHRPRHELSTDTNTPHSPQPNTDRALRSHRTHAAGRSNRVWQVRQHRVFGARFLVSATSNTRSNHRCESPEPGLRAVRLFHIDRHRPATQTPLRPRVHRNDRRDRSGLRIAPDTPRPKPPACPKALPIVVEGT